MYMLDSDQFEKGSFSTVKNIPQTLADQKLLFPKITVEKMEYSRLAINSVVKIKCQTYSV